MSSELVTRAVLLAIEPGQLERCVACREPVMFSARTHLLRVVANVYVDDHWDHIDIFHTSCYDDAGQPHGVPVTKIKQHRETRERHG